MNTGVPRATEDSTCGPLPRPPRRASSFSRSRRKHQGPAQRQPERRTAPRPRSRRACGPSPRTSPPAPRSPAAPRGNSFCHGRKSRAAHRCRGRAGRRRDSSGGRARLGVGLALAAAGLAIRKYEATATMGTRESWRTALSQSPQHISAPPLAGSRRRLRRGEEIERVHFQTVHRGRDPEVAVRVAQGGDHHLLVEEHSGLGHRGRARAPRRPRRRPPEGATRSSPWPCPPTSPSRSGAAAARTG